MRFAPQPAYAAICNKPVLCNIVHIIPMACDWSAEWQSIIVRRLAGGASHIQGDLPDCCDRFADKPLMSRLGSALTWHRLHRVFLSFDPQIVQYLWQS